MSFISKLVKWFTQPDVSRHSIVVTARASQEKGNYYYLPYLCDGENNNDGKIKPVQNTNAEHLHKDHDRYTKWAEENGKHYVIEVAATLASSLTSAVAYYELSHDRESQKTAPNPSLQYKQRNTADPTPHPIA